MPYGGNPQYGGYQPQYAGYQQPIDYSQQQAMYYNQQPQYAGYQQPIDYSQQQALYYNQAPQDAGNQQPITYEQLIQYGNQFGRHAMLNYTSVLQPNGEQLFYFKPRQFGGQEMPLFRN